MSEFPVRKMHSKSRSVVTLNSLRGEIEKLEESQKLLLKQNREMLSALRSISDRVPAHVAGDGATETARETLRKLGYL